MLEVPAFAMMCGLMRLDIVKPVGYNMNGS